MNKILLICTFFTTISATTLAGSGDAPLGDILKGAEKLKVDFSPDSKDCTYGYKYRGKSVEWQPFPSNNGWFESSDRAYIIKKLPESIYKVTITSVGDLPVILRLSSGRNGEVGTLERYIKQLNLRLKSITIDNIGDTTIRIGTLKTEGSGTGAKTILLTVNGSVSINDKNYHEGSWLATDGGKHIVRFDPTLASLILASGSIKGTLLKRINQPVVRSEPEYFNIKEILKANWDLHDRVNNDFEFWVFDRIKHETDYRFSLNGTIRAIEELVYEVFPAEKSKNSVAESFLKKYTGPESELVKKAIKGFSGDLSDGCVIAEDEESPIKDIVSQLSRIQKQLKEIAGCADSDAIPPFLLHTYSVNSDGFLNTENIFLAYSGEENDFLAVDVNAFLANLEEGWEHTEVRKKIDEERQRWLADNEKAVMKLIEEERELRAKEEKERLEQEQRNLINLLNFLDELNKKPAKKFIDVMIANFTEKIDPKGNSRTTWGEARALFAENISEACDAYNAQYETIRAKYFGQSSPALTYTMPKPIGMS